MGIVSGSHSSSQRYRMHDFVEKPRSSHVLFSYMNSGVDRQRQMAYSESRETAAT